MNLLDEPNMRVLAQLMADEPGFLADSTADGIRKLVDRIQALNGSGPEMTRVTEHSVAVGEAAVRVRLLQPIPEPRGVIISLALGGWVAGTLESFDSVARKLAERTSCTFALIDFRRAPEYRYPAAADDVYAAARWLWHERSALGHEGLPHMILGEGMGATLAAVAVARARSDRYGPRFALQFLICPVTDAGAVTSSSDAPTISRAALNRFWDWYVTDSSQWKNPDVSPLRIPDCRGLPPTVVVTAEFDPALDEARAFVQRLRQDGSPVAHRHYEGQMHGFFGILALPLGERVFQHVVRAVRGYTARLCTAGAPPPDVGQWLDRTIK